LNESFLGFEAALDILKKRIISSFWQVKKCTTSLLLDGSMAAQSLSCLKQYDHRVIMNLNIVIKPDNFD
jgi:hypothetical protein